MNILVIGNGFDLAHGLPTKYYDFIQFIKFIKVIYIKEAYERNSIIKDKIRISEESLDINKNILEKLLDESIYKTNHFKEFILCINNNLWIEYFKNKVKIQNTWVDFEMSIKEVIELLDIIKRKHKEEISIENFDISNLREIMNIFLNYDKPIYLYKNTDFGQFKKDLNNKFIENLELDLKKLIRALEIYISLFIENIDLSLYKGKVENIDKVISFNYSNTFERLYGLHNIECDYIHGKANLEREINKNNMVLGIDEYLDDEIKDKYLDFIFFKKYFQRIYKRTGCNYKYWLEEIVESNEESNIYFYGHSLSRADNDILRDLILCENIKVHIFYHSDDAYRSQITNLVDVIGQDKLIEKVYGSNATIIFESTEDKEQLEIIGGKSNNRLATVI
ncbi:AbiH family protein [Clostridium tertium]|uniref:AbiH family protein n=1 Tax=Clostridium tertium TaxID=1559 RepID=UPI000BE40DBB|nr:AbiH family protein [Clostridium tertium]